MPAQTSMKASILKAVVWNSQGYIQPSGEGATGGYPADHGFGHEEWNNNPNWYWRSYRIFHTEYTARLLTYSECGQLGMLMIVSHDGRQWAVGVAAGIFHNSVDDMKLIATELKLEENWRQLWELPLVRRKHNNDQSAFRRFWKEQCQWIRWKAEPEMYHWFKTPIPLNPIDLSGKQFLTKMFGKFQPVQPDRIAKLIRKHIPKAKASIVNWFEDGPFDERFLARKSSARRRGLDGGNKGNSPADRAVRYWVYGERVAEPLHSRLQAQFVDYLRAQGFVVEENTNFVDIRYRPNKNSVFVEVKPTEKVPPRYAIRAAIGQLLEYRHVHDNAAELEIVISSEPEAAQIDLLKSLGIRLWCRVGDAFNRLA